MTEQVLTVQLTEHEDFTMDVLRIEYTRRHADNETDIILVLYDENGLPYSFPAMCNGVTGLRVALLRAFDSALSYHKETGITFRIQSMRFDTLLFHALRLQDIYTSTHLKNALQAYVDTFVKNDISKYIVDRLPCTLSSGSLYYNEDPDDSTFGMLEIIAAEHDNYENYVDLADLRASVDMLSLYDDSEYVVVDETNNRYRPMSYLFIMPNTPAWTMAIDDIINQLDDYISDAYLSEVEREIIDDYFDSFGYRDSFSALQQLTGVSDETMERWESEGLDPNNESFWGSLKSFLYRWFYDNMVNHGGFTGDSRLLKRVIREELWSLTESYRPGRKFSEYDGLLLEISRKLETQES